MNVAQYNKTFHYEAAVKPWTTQLINDFLMRCFCKELVLLNRFDEAGAKLRALGSYSLTTRKTVLWLGFTSVADVPQQLYINTNACNSNDTTAIKAANVTAI